MHTESAQKYALEAFVFILEYIHYCINKYVKLTCLMTLQLLRLSTHEVKIHKTYINVF